MATSFSGGGSQSTFIQSIEEKKILFWLGKKKNNLVWLQLKKNKNVSNCLKKKSDQYKKP
jgi:hypothetical protein